MAKRLVETSSYHLLCLRHGEPEATTRGRVYGKLDVGLSERGREQIRAAGRRLPRWPVAAVYTSPRIRAKESADIIVRASGVPVVIEPAFAEIDFGRFEGRSYEEIERSDPDLYQQWMTAPTTVRFPGGESFDDLRKRVCTKAAELRRAHDGESILLVAHGGVLRALLADALGLPAEQIFRLDQAYAGISHVEYFGETPLLRLLNG